MGFFAAFEMHLVGWLKVRSTTMIGHLQGDVYALSYFRKWLEEKHITPKAGIINALRIYEVNIGLDKPLEYKTLLCVKDKRKYGKRKIHMLAQLEKLQIQRLEQESVEKR